jgi:two-component system NtrC family sensor kinase
VAQTASNLGGLEPLGAAVLDAIPVSLYIVDRRLRVVAWNKKRETGPQGRPRREALGRPLGDLLSAEGRRLTLPVLKRVFATGQPHEETTETTGARVFQVRRWPVRQGRTVTHVLSWFDEITERRALEMQLIASDRLAFLGQLVAGVAHEISNPLAGIAGCAEALASIALDNPGAKARREAREFRDLVRGEVSRCERIVSSLLGAARGSPGQTAALAPTVRAALRLLERHPSFARVRVQCRVPDELPIARIDPDSLRQVIVALAANAARAMPGGGTLRVKGALRAGDLVLDVEDTGPGVPKEIRPRIFEPFFTTDSVGGTGLGLAIARSLVRGRGGDLVYRPGKRAGGSFRVVLKRIQGAA